MLKIPNFNKKEKEILESAIKKYQEVNNLKEVKLTKEKIIEIVKDAHNKWEIVTSIPQHKLMDSIRKKCGEVFETMEAKTTRQELERVASLKEKARQMRNAIKKKHEEEMEKEIAYWGVDEKELDKTLSVKANNVTNSSSRVEIYKGTMDDSSIEGEKTEVEDDGVDFIGNISTPAIEEEEVVKEEVVEMVEEAKEKAIEEIQEVKEEVEEVIKEAKKEIEIDIDAILDNL